MKPRHNDDYCGPAGDGIIAKIFSWFIADKIGAVDVGALCCKPHDDDNTKNGANKAGDEKLKFCIECALRKEGYPEWIISYYKYKYFYGVRVGNPFYKSPSELLTDIKKELKRKIK